MLWKISTLIVVSAFLLGISWKALRDPGSHGFYRFFAWETILILFLLQVDFWFVDPFSWYQSIAWTLLLLRLPPVIWGSLLLHRHGRPASVRPAEPGLVSFEKTTRLVTDGIYRFIRHPLYASLLLLAWGIFFKHPGWAGGCLTAVSSAFLVRTARADEAECTRFFGKPYQDYMKTTKRFIPFIY